MDLGSNESKMVEKIAIEYYLKGETIASALRKAQQEVIKSNAQLSKLTRKQKLVLEKQILFDAKKIQEEKRASEEAANRKANRQKELEERTYLSKSLRNFKAYLLKKKRAFAKSNSSKDNDKTFSSAFQNFPNKIGAISAYTGAIAVIGAVTSAVKYAITKTIEYEKAFTDLGVKAGYTSGEVNKVGKAVLSTAAASKFSTLEIVSAATALGKLGFKAKENVDMLPQVAAVAAATGESLSSTAESIGKVIRAYDIAANNTSVVSDRMVSIFNSSALNLQKFNMAFAYTGAAAESTGTSFTELTSAMAILSDRGITASKVGTGLRNIFIKLGSKGKDLRDILQDVSDENLSFYETAELVGNRAATQLFTLANSIEEFDSKVADSQHQFGAALAASATQMDTFSAQWDIFINTITDTVAAPSFDKDGTFETKLHDSLGLMKEFNAMISGSAGKASLKGLVYQNRELVKFFKEYKSLPKNIGKTDEELINELKETHYKRFTSMRADYNRRKALFKLNFTLNDKQKEEESNKLDKMKDSLNKEKAVWSGYDSLYGMLKSVTFNTDIINPFSKAIKEYDVDKDANDLKVKALEVQDRVLKILKSVEVKYGKKRGVQLKGFISELKTEQIKGLVDSDILTTDDANYIVKNISKVTEKTLDKIRKASDMTYEDYLRSKYKKETKGIDTIDGASGVRYATQLAGKKLDDIKNLKSRLSDLDSLRKEICENIPSLAAELGFQCKNASKHKRKSENFSRFDRNSSEDEAYKNTKNELKNDYMVAEKNGDILKQQKIRQKQILLEKDYREFMFNSYKSYLDKMASAKDAYLAKNPNKKEEFESYMNSIKDYQTKSNGEGTRNVNDLTNSANELKSKQYEQDIVDKQNYIREMAKLENELKGKRVSPKERKAYYDKMNKLTNEFYDKEINKSRSALDKLKDLLLQVEASNLSQKETFGNDAALIDTKGIEEKIQKLEGQIAKLMATKESSQKNGVGKKRDFDYVGAAIEMSNNLYNVYEEAADRELELLKQKTDRELEVISRRYDEEKEIRDSALESGIISMEQATEAEERARERKIDAENLANKKLFDAQKKRDKEDAIFKGATSIAQATALSISLQVIPPVAAVMAAISAAAITASVASNLAAISSRKFIPKKYADGGIVYGKSHRNGGVPFTVRGNGGYEMEGGEFIVNKESTRLHLAELERINKSKGHFNIGRKFARGGVVNTASADANTEMLNILIEEFRKPVRAYVTDQDLAKSNSEREALTKKVNY